MDEHLIQIYLVLFVLDYAAYTNKYASSSFPSCHCLCLCMFSFWLCVIGSEQMDIPKWNHNLMKYVFNVCKSN